MISERLEPPEGPSVLLWYTEACKIPRPEPTECWIDLKDKIPILEDMFP